ncbi:unnamed protein product [Arabidopsis thaliana]|uniref:RNase H type-1 domain-containing protein n=1 Tax=Arabidopsis thaliana TaxID=3702 RepID=A0A654G560_ARATH|nr:unnamed protein product [Arabidopsis thaliana]
MADETRQHLFFGCLYAQAVWRATKVSRTEYFNPILSIEDKLKLVIQSHTDKRNEPLRRQLPLWTLWRIWKSRNLLVYQRQSNTWETDAQKATSDAFDWIPNQRSFNDTSKITHLGLSKDGWRKPKKGYKKCNYDSSYKQNGEDVNAGWILRDEEGYYIEAAQSKAQTCNTVLEAELLALLMAMQHMWIRGHRHLIFEGDNSKIPKLITGETRNFTLHNLIQEIRVWQQRFTNVKIQWTPRQGNKAGDCLAKNRRYNDVAFSNHFHVPRVLVHILHENHTSSS